MPQQPRSIVDDALAADRLGAPTIIAFAMTAAAPLMVIGGVVTVGWATTSSVTGITAYPLAFIVVAAVLTIFSIGYMAMARRINNTGAFYSYVAHGLGKPPGVAAAFIAFASYNLLQVGLYGIFGATISGFLADKAGLDMPWWLYAAAAWLVVSLLGVLRVDINGKVLLAIVACEVVLVVIFDAFFLASPSPEGYSLATLAPDNLFLPGIGATLVTIFTAFVGFEAAAVYSEESRDRVRTVPVATYLAIGIMVVFYAITSWAIAITVGNDNLVKAAQDTQTEMMFDQAATLMGNPIIADAGVILLITSIFAAMLSYHNTVARYTFALAREHVLPNRLARTGLRSGSPKNASMLQSVLGAGAIILYALTGWDPLQNMFFWLGMTGGFGVLVLVAITAVSIVCYFLRDPGGTNVFTRLIAPTIAAIILAVIVYFGVDSYADLLGFPPNDPGRDLWWTFPAGFVIIAVIGIVRALQLRATAPQVYAEIGTRGRPTDTTTHTPQPAQTTGGLR